MKKYIRLAACLTGMIFIGCMTSSPISAQVPLTPAMKSSIPAEVMKITRKSCTKCHIDGESGGLKFTAWDTYTPEKQASKAKAICNEVTKGFMPPSRYINNNPAAKLTQEEMKTLCDWAATVKAPKK